jgi:hypothetical protein
LIPRPIGDLCKISTIQVKSVAAMRAHTLGIFENLACIKIDGYMLTLKIIRQAYFCGGKLKICSEDVLGCD